MVIFIFSKYNNKQIFIIIIFYYKQILYYYGDYNFKEVTKMLSL